MTMLDNQFLGFDTLKSNTTYTPNQFLDTIVKHGSTNAIRIIAYLLRRTYGAVDRYGVPHDEELFCSLSEFAKHAGIHRTDVPQAIRDAFALGVIDITDVNRAEGDSAPTATAAYALKFSEPDVPYSTELAHVQEHGFFNGLGNYTQVPNDFFDNCIAKHTKSTFAVVAAIIRHSIGFAATRGSRRMIARFSLPQLVNTIGSSEKTVRRGIAAAIEHHFILRTFTHKDHCYCLRWVDEITTDPQYPAQSAAPAKPTNTKFGNAIEHMRAIFTPTAKTIEQAKKEGGGILTTPSKADPEGSGILTTPSKADPEGSGILTTPSKKDPGGSGILTTSPSGILTTPIVLKVFNKIKTTLITEAEPATDSLEAELLAVGLTKNQIFTLLKDFSRDQIGQQLSNLTTRKDVVNRPATLLSSIRGDWKAVLAEHPLAGSLAEKWGLEGSSSNKIQVSRLLSEIGIPSTTKFDELPSCLTNIAAKWAPRKLQIANQQKEFIKQQFADHSKALAAARSSAQQQLQVKEKLDSSEMREAYYEFLSARAAAVDAETRQRWRAANGYARGVLSTVATADFEILRRSDSPADFTEQLIQAASEAALMSPRPTCAEHIRNMYNTLHVRITHAVLFLASIGDTQAEHDFFEKIKC